MESDNQWVDLVANENISVLFNLHPDVSKANQFIWSASVTVLDPEVTPSTGNFHWQVVSGELEVWVN